MSTNPFQSPGEPPLGAFPPAPLLPAQPELLKDDLLRVPWTMNYMGGIDMIHRRPDWLGNAFLAGICMFIPVVGSLVLVGYTFECAEVLNRTRGAFYPKFEFNRFSDYLIRGVGPFLVQMLLGLVQIPIFIVCYVGMIAGFLGASTAGEGNEGAAVAVVISVMLGLILFIFIVSILLYFLYLPLALRGGMANDIGQSFQFGWAMKFCKLMWKEMLLAWLLQIGASMVISLIAVVTCYIGLIPGITYMLLIQAWLCFQLYRVFLFRGGEAIPFKPLPYAVNSVS